MNAQQNNSTTKHYEWNWWVLPPLQVASQIAPSKGRLPYTLHASSILLLGEECRKFFSPFLLQYIMSLLSSISPDRLGGYGSMKINSLNIEQQASDSGRHVHDIIIRKNLQSWSKTISLLFRDPERKFPCLAFPITLSFFYLWDIGDRCSTFTVRTVLYVGTVHKIIISTRGSCCNCSRTYFVCTRTVVYLLYVRSVDACIFCIRNTYYA